MAADKEAVGLSRVHMYESRSLGSNHLAAVSKPGQFLISPRCLSSLSCINDYQAAIKIYEAIVFQYQSPREIKLVLE